MEGWDKPPSHAWHLSRRRCHGEGLLCKWVTQPPEMQPDIQEDAISPSACCCSLMEEWNRCWLFSQANLSRRSMFSPLQRSDKRLERVHCRPKDMLHQHTRAAKLQCADTQTSPAANTASAGQQVWCEKLLAAQEQLKTRLLLRSVMDEAAMLVLALTETQLNLLGSR